MIINKYTVTDKFSEDKGIKCRWYVIDDKGIIILNNNALHINDAELLCELANKSLDKTVGHLILDNSLFQDNVSEALYEVIEEGGREFNMLVCEAKDKDGELYQLHIRAIRMDHADHIDNAEEMPMFSINDEHRLIQLQDDYPEINTNDKN